MVDPSGPSQGCNGTQRTSQVQDLGVSGLGFKVLGV